MIAGLLGAGVAAAGLAAAWIAGRIAGRFWFALGVIVAGEAIAGLLWLVLWPVEPGRSETATWPMALAFAAALSLLLSLYGVLLRRLRRRLSRRFGRG